MPKASSVKIEGAAGLHATKARYMSRSFSSTVPRAIVVSMQKYSPKSAAATPAPAHSTVGVRNSAHQVDKRRSCSPESQDEAPVTLSARSKRKEKKEADNLAISGARGVAGMSWASTLLNSEPGSCPVCLSLYQPYICQQTAAVDEQGFTTQVFAEATTEDGGAN